MKSVHLGFAACCAVSLGLLGPPARAQWSSDPALGFALADKLGIQAQPKIAPTSDGGYYVSWFDSDAAGSPPFGYDVYLQRVDALGREQWAHDGILIADRGFSSTQDYGLAVDGSDHALLAFRDDRPGGIQITATRVSPAGTQVWGALGVQLTSTAAFVAAPKIAATSSGDVVVAWTQDASTKLQQLDASGVPQWGVGLTLTPGAGSYSASHLEQGDAGSVVLAFVHQTGPFGSPRHLLGQKYDAAGAALWGAGHVAVWDGGSLQFGNFPTFVPDGAGGAVFAWYSSSPSLQCFAQHVTAAGAEAFPHNGTPVSTDASQDRVSPSVAWDAQAGHAYVFWTEQDLGVFGVYGQKLDAAGARQWGSGGSVLVPLASTEITQVRALDAGSAASAGALAAWVRGSNTSQTVHAAHVDPTGAFAVLPFDVSSTAARKSRLGAATSAIGFGAFVWEDTRADSDGDIWIQDVLADGELGPGGVPFCHGTGASCPCGGGSGDAGCDNPQATGGVALTLAGFAPNGLGEQELLAGEPDSLAAGGGTAMMDRIPRDTAAFGGGLRCLGVAGLVRFGATSAAGGASTHTSGHGAGAGVFHYQIWYRSTPSTFCDPFAAFNLSNGLSVMWP